MNPAIVARNPRDAGLWMVSALIALVVHLVALAFFAIAVILQWIVAPAPPAVPVVPEAEAPLILIPVVREKPKEGVPANEDPPLRPKPRTRVRTSKEQETEAPDHAVLTGRYNTRAGADAVPTKGALDSMPALQGEEREEKILQTYESRFVDGSIASEVTDGGGKGIGRRGEGSDTTTVNRPLVTGEQSKAQARDRQENLAEGPSPIDVKRRVGKKKRVPEGDRSDEEPVTPHAADSERRIKLEEGRDDGEERDFESSFDRVQLKGSISRSGKPALDVKTGPLGKYYGAVTSSIERNWLKAAARNRDFITPGVLRVQVVLDSKGAVRSVGMMDEVGVTSIQRGFTFSSIREAELPPMPEEVRRELNGEPLELLYNFIF